MHNTITVLFFLIFSQTGLAQETNQCSDGGLNSLLKSKGFERGSSEGKQNIQFDLTTFSKRRIAAREKAAASPEMQEIDRQFEKLFPFEKFQKSVDAYTARVARKNDLEIQKERATPSEKNNFKTSPKLASITKELFKANQELIPFKRDLLREYSAIQSLHLGCNANYIWQMDRQGALTSKLMAASYLLGVNRIRDVPGYERTVRNSPNSKVCKDLKALSKKQTELEAKFEIEEQKAAEKPLLDLKHGKYLLQYLKTYPLFLPAKLQTLEMMTNTKGETAWVFVVDGKAHSAITLNEVSSQKLDFQRIELSSSSCKMNFRKMEVEKVGESWSTRYGPKVNEELCTVVNRYKSDPFAWLTISREDSWKQMAECTQQGGEYFGSKYKSTCRCKESGKEITPRVETCLKERFSDTAEKFRNEVLKASEGEGSEFFVSKKENIVEACEENFAHAMGRKEDPSAGKSGLK